MAIAVALLTPGTVTGVGEHGPLPHIEPAPFAPIWPSESSPQQATEPPDTRAHTDVSNKESAVTSSEVETTTGDVEHGEDCPPTKHVSGEFAKDSPSSPVVLFPMHSTDPEMTAHVTEVPVANAVIPAPKRGVGVKSHGAPKHEVAGCGPSAPKGSAPQHSQVSETSAQVCDPPAAIAVTFDTLGTGTGVSKDALTAAPLPSSA